MGIIVDTVKKGDRAKINDAKANIRKLNDEGAYKKCLPLNIANNLDDRKCHIIDDNIT